ncbi:MAG: TetR family transcriptional regulator [Actinomycetota bacterium]|nr:TetR family transcriptional regulator [Actinomycetota bacterium]
MPATDPSPDADEDGHDDLRERPRRRSEIGDESRRRILDAAEKLFAERGVADTSFAAIQREAGISRGSIPWHFTNKHGLLLAIVDRAMLMADFDEIEARGEDGLRELCERSLELSRRPQAMLLTSLLGESFREDSATHERYRHWHDRCRRTIAELLDEWSDELDLPDGVDVRSLAAVLFGAGMGLHQQWRLAPDLVDLEASFAALEAVVLAALRPSS